MERIERATWEYWAFGLLLALLPSTFVAGLAPYEPLVQILMGALTLALCIQMHRRNVKRGRPKEPLWVWVFLAITGTAVVALPMIEPVLAQR